MDMTITEGQKRMLTVVFAIVIVIFLYTLAILPTNKSIDTAKKEDETLAKEEDTMSALISNGALEVQLKKLIDETEITFQKLFVPNENGYYIVNRLKEENIGTFAWETPLEYTVVGQEEYFKYIAQPTTSTQLAEAKRVAGGGGSDSASSDTIADLGLFQKNVCNITAYGKDTEELMKFYDFLNNVPPTGAGDVEPMLYCWMIDSVSFDVEDGEPVFDESMEDQPSLIYYGMKEPLTEVPEMPTRQSVAKAKADASATTTTTTK